MLGIDEKLRVFTAFSGYDSQCMALDRIGANYELVGWSEIEDNAIKAHNAIYPQWAERNYGDISKIDWKKVPDFDLFTYSSPCLTADNLILTKDGYKPIVEINIGEEVLTKSGSWHKVLKKFDNGIHSTCYIKALGFESIHCTLNHKFWAREMKRVGHKRVRTLLEPQFVEAKDLTKKHYLGIPIDKSESLPEWNGVEDNRWGHHRRVNAISEWMKRGDFWYLMGRYVGDGWKKESATGKGIVICCGGRYEEALQEAIYKLGLTATVVKERTVRKYQISSNELFSFVGRFGYYAHGKKIDGETMRLPLAFLKCFITGVLDSDGCFTQNHYKMATSSRELAYGIAYCVNKAYNRPARIYKTKRSPKTIIESREVNQRDSYEVVFTCEKLKQEHSFVEDGYVWYPFQEMILGELESVYNIEVEEDHSYVVNGCISKNCQDFSQAGLQRGGTEGTGTRSSLLWECRKAIVEKRPKYCMLENVAALVSQKFLPLFKKWMYELHEYGYTNYWQVLNATDFNVPQNRERVFLVSILGDQYFRFPDPVPLTTKLVDVLQENVDESYYVSGKSIESFIANNSEIGDEEEDESQMSLWD